MSGNVISRGFNFSHGYCLVVPGGGEFQRRTEWVVLAHCCDSPSTDLSDVVTRLRYLGGQAADCVANQPRHGEMSGSVLHHHHHHASLSVMFRSASRPSDVFVDLFVTRAKADRCTALLVLLWSRRPCFTNFYFSINTLFRRLSTHSFETVNALLLATEALLCRFPCSAS